MSLVERSFVPKSPVVRDRHIPESLLVIGTGSVGYRHLMNASHLGVPSLSVFTTGRGVSRTRLQDSVVVERDLARAFSRGVKTVVIANPTSLHVHAALEAVRAGCHLF